MSATRIPVADVPPGSVKGSEGYAVGNNGDYFAVSRRCRHLRADLAEGQHRLRRLPGLPMAPG